MKVISVNVGQPKEYTLDGVTLQTSMARTPQNSIQIQFKQVIGDLFAGPHVHGTPEAVVYSLSSDRFPAWSEFLGFEVKAGQLGENLTLDQQNEEDVMCGDEYQVGTALLRVTGPRYPCNRLNFATGNKKMQREFEKRAWSGVYYEVAQEGSAKAGDQLKLIKRVQSDISVRDVFLAMREGRTGQPASEKVRRMINSPHMNSLFVQRIKKSYGLT